MSRTKRRRLSVTREVTSAETIAHDSLEVTEDNSVKNTEGSHSEHTKSLFVRSLPKTANLESLTNFFSQSYPLKHATIVSDPVMKISKGFGFVTFADAEDAKGALETYNGSLFEGHKIKVEAAEARQREPQEGGETRKKRPHASLTGAGSKPVGVRQSDHQGPPKLIVRNLPWTIIRPEQLAALFSKHAKVKHAIIPKKGPGLSPGFGFVVLQHRKDGDHALRAVNGQEIEGRTLAVDWAVEKTVWDALQKGQNEHLQSQITEDDMVIDVSTGIQSNANDESYVPPKATPDDAPDADDIDYANDVDNTDEADNINDGGDANDADDVDNAHHERELHEISGDGPPKGLIHEEEDRIRHTLFIQNIPFTVTDEVLMEHFQPFGSLRYARIVLDAVTERSKGVGFVSFYQQENADACLRGAPPSLRMNTDKIVGRAGGNLPASRSLLENYSADVSGRYTLDGRILHVSRAIRKGEAERLTAANRSLRDSQDKDKRRLYLLSEGSIPTYSPLFNQLAASEIKMREDGARQRQNLIKNNPSLHLSLTRLSIRNLSQTVTSKTLKALARQAVVGFATEVRTGIRQPLSREEISRGGQAMKEAEKVHRAKGKGIVRQAKVVFEGREGRKVTERSGAGRSRGYGFIEYTSHRWALMGLRWLNGHGLKDVTEHARDSRTTREEVKEKNKRLIVEFAVENSQVTGRRQEREVRARERSQLVHGEGTNKDMTDSRGEAFDTAVSNFQEIGKVRRKRIGTESSRNTPIIRPTSTVLNRTKDRPNESGNDGEVVRRQRMIGKKRMIRKHRKAT